VIQTQCTAPTKGSANSSLHTDGNPWWWEAAPLQTPTSKLPDKADVVIVGGGYTGLSAALQLLRHDLSVAIVEQARPGEGASSRNGGMLGSGHKLSYGAMQKRFGHDTALRILQEGIDSLHFTRELIQREKIECHLDLCGRFRGAWTQQDYQDMADDVAWMREHVGLNASMVSESDQYAEVNTERYHGGCIYHDHGSLHPGLFHAGLLERVLQAGGVISCENQALAISTDGARKVLTTSLGEIRARHIILATNGYRTGLNARWRKSSVPVASYLIATEELPEGVAEELIPSNRMIVESRKRFGYYRRSPDGRRIIFGGRAALDTIDTDKSQAVLRDVMVDLFPMAYRTSHAWKMASMWSVVTTDQAWRWPLTLGIKWHK